MKLTIKFTLTCNQVYLKCISNQLRCKDAHFGYPENFSPFQKWQSLQMQRILQSQLSSECSPASSLLPLAGGVTAPIQISVRKLIVTWSGSVFCRTNKLIQRKYKAIACPDAIERSWRGHAASKHRGRQIPPFNDS